MSNSLRWVAAAVVVFSLLWVPSVGRAQQSLVTGHAIGSSVKLSKDAVLPHDPSLPYIASTAPVVAPPVSFIRFIPVDHPVSAVDHAREGAGLRAPPVLVP